MKWSKKDSLDYIGRHCLITPKQFILTTQETETIRFLCEFESSLGYISNLLTKIKTKQTNKTYHQVKTKTAKEQQQKVKSKQDLK